MVHVIKHPVDNFIRDESNPLHFSGSRFHRVECLDDDMWFLEELVTTPDLGDLHAPVNTYATLQLPYHAKVGRHVWPTSKDR